MVTRTTSPTTVTLVRYCERCKDHTRHRSVMRGGTETITCTVCSKQQSYKVR